MEESESNGIWIQLTSCICTNPISEAVLIELKYEKNVSFTKKKKIIFAMSTTNMSMAVGLTGVSLGI